LYPLGEFVEVTRDEDLHYIKIDVDLIYLGYNFIQMKSLHDAMRDVVNKTLSGLKVQQAKEDYIDNFLHKEIEKRLNELLNDVSSGSLRIIDVQIPEFLVN